MALKAAGQPTCSAARPAAGLAGSTWLSGLGTLFEGDSWPPTPDDLNAVIGLALKGRRRPKVWQEHYNAACIYAVAMLELKTPTATLSAGARVIRKLARAAIDELVNAASCTDSGFLARQRSWLESEDPDLALLRSTDLFRDFVTATFAMRQPVPRCPGAIHIWQMNSYKAALIRAAATAMEQEWHRRTRAITGTVDAHVLDTWWREDSEAWRMAAEIASDHRDWPTRADVLTLTQRWAQRAIGTQLTINFPTYSEQTLARQYQSLIGSAPGRNGSTEPVTDWASAVIDAGDRRLAELAWIIHRGRAKAPAKVERVCIRCLDGPGVVQREHQLWSRKIARADTTGIQIGAKQARRLCQRCSERWRNLATWFDDQHPDVPDVTVRRRAFADSIATPIEWIMTVRSVLTGTLR